MNDDDFVNAFLAGSIPPTQFHHRDHLRLAWGLTRRHGTEAATHEIAAGIQRFAAQHGHFTKYHETLTLFWVRIVNHHMQMRPDCPDFANFIELFPQLLDKTLPERHWRHETLTSPAARAQWVEPDLLALPA